MSTATLPRIGYLDGIRFRRALVAGARQLIGNRDHLNAINVFPVADGDTGSNMAGTVSGIMEGITASTEKAMNRMLRAVADLALGCARGCSGTILAQFFHGLAQELPDAARVSTGAFGRGVRRAVTYPWEAVAEPKDGTILTVLRDWGETIYEWSMRTDDFVEMLAHAQRTARLSLAATRKKLAVLSLAGVVDAGAQGLVHLLGGITGFIATGRIREVDRFAPLPVDGAEMPAEAAVNPAYRYCTQFVLEGADMDVAAPRAELGGMGNSLIVAGSAARAKIHLHSNTPAQAFQRVDRHGTVRSQRIEDMAAQYRAAHGPHGDVALVVDSSCDLPAEIWDRHSIHMVPCQLFLDGRTYLDKLSITPATLFSILREKPRAIPTTSQPAPADFKGRYEFLLAHYRSVISLSMPASISGTFDAARAGARLAQGPRGNAAGGGVTVIDTQATSVGLGLIARSAAEAIEGGADRDQVVRLVQSLIPRVRIHLTVASLDSLVRSGRVSRMKGFAANLLGLKPLIRLSAQTGGRPVQGSTVFGVKGGRRRILRLMHAEIDARRPAEVAIAHADALDDALWFKRRIMEEFALAREPFIVDATPVLVAHIGVGAVAVAYILPEA